MRQRDLALALVLAVGACGGGSGGSGGDDDDVPDAGPGSGPHPFGTHGSYVTDGVLYPQGGPSPALDDATAAAYDAWKARYLEPACEPGQYRVKTAPATGAYTVSEGHGYGMLLTVLLDGHDPDAKREFDGLYAYYAAHPSANDPGLMAWAQDAQCANVEGPDSATDGDLDIAYALLLADQQWGSDGDVDYRAAADRIIASIYASEIHPSGSILIGDWAGADDPHYTGTRPSDFMPDHFRAYGGAAAPAVVDRVYAIVSALQTSASPDTGLLPDFVVGATGDTPAPAPPSWLEDTTDGAYAWNACRTPWRLGTDYLITGEPRARAAVRTMTAWFRSATGDDPANVVDGYQLDGTPIGSGPELAFVAPLAVGAMIEAESGSNQAWLDALWTRLVSAGPSDYYGDSIRVLAMVVASGNWWAP